MQAVVIVELKVPRQPLARFPWCLVVVQVDFLVLDRSPQALRLKLGAWTGAFSVSEHDPMAREHPEWLLGSADEHPYPVMPTWT